MFFTSRSYTARPIRGTRVIAVLLAVIALLDRLPLNAFMHSEAPFLAFFKATMVSAALSSFSPEIFPARLTS
jgi:hypothetical protein